MADRELTAEQEAEAQRLADRVMVRTREEVLQIARLLVSKADRELLGKTEFEVRDRVHKIGAHAIETALEERKKGGTKGRQCPALAARNQRNSRGIVTRTSSVCWARFASGVATIPVGTVKAAI